MGRCQAVQQQQQQRAHTHTTSRLALVPICLRGTLRGGGTPLITYAAQLQPARLQPLRTQTSAAAVQPLRRAARA